MVRARREVLKIGSDLAVDFANTAYSPGRTTGALHSWSDLVDFLELRGGVAPGDGAVLRAMGETEARGCAAAFAQAMQLRETIRAMLGAMASKRPLRAQWVAEVNQALAWGSGAARLVRQDSGWRLGFSPGSAGPLRALAPIARTIADLAGVGTIDASHLGEAMQLRRGLPEA